MAEWKLFERAAQVIPGRKMRPVCGSEASKQGYEIKEKSTIHRKPTIIFTNGNILSLADAKRGWEICPA